MALDGRARALLGPWLQRLVPLLRRLRATPGRLTAAGLLLALAAAVAAGAGLWLLALGLWLVSRLADGLDGVLARADDAGTDLGGYLDIVADLVAYGAFVAGVGVGEPSARVACLVLLVTYYANGGAFLALSSIAERRRQRVADDGRSLQFVGGLAEGTETIVVHSLLALAGLLAPTLVAPLAWVFAAAVAVTVAQRVAVARRVLA